MRKRYYGLLYCISIAGLFGFGADAQAEFVLERNAELGQNGLVAERVLEALITGTNASIRTPETIIAGVASCGGVENALYMREPEQSRPVVVICEELVNRMVVDSQSAFSAFPGFRQASLAGQLIFVIAHEFGHALVDVLQLPVTGNEEDVADQFATWILSDEPAALYGASLFWLARSGTAPTASAFADTHALNEQRYFNVLCWGYGADPMGRSWMVSGVPQDRVQHCARQYTQMSTALSTLLQPHETSSGSISSLVNTSTRNATGIWNMQTVVSADSGERCTLTGSVRLVQLGDVLDGESQLRITCEARGEASASAIELTITDGSVAGNGTVAFAAGNCTFDGQFSDADRMTLNGEVLCGGTQTMMGNFQAIR